MSETKLVGTCGIMVDDDVYGRGPLVTLPGTSEPESTKCITICRFGSGGRRDEVDIYHNEAREVAAQLLAFAEAEAS